MKFVLVILQFVQIRNSCSFVSNSLSNSNYEIKFKELLTVLQISTSESGHVHDARTKTVRMITFFRVKYEKRT